MFVLIDNYDSFTYNLFHYLGELGAEIVVHRNDQITVDELLALAPQGVIMSPGPRTPDDAGICLELVEKCAGTLPLLGVCLGHQSIAQAMGGKVVRAPYLMHGKVSNIVHEGGGLFAGLPTTFEATRYHSLVVDPDSLPDCLEVTAKTEDGIIMGLSHKELEVHGVQFHPESIASQYGHDLLKNFLDRATGSSKAA